MNTQITAHQSKEIDKYASEVLGLPSIVLMENAAINASAVICSLLQERCAIDAGNARVGVICGGGNNGGDGYAIARHLSNQGAGVIVYATKKIDQLAGDARINARVCSRMGMEIILLEDVVSTEQATRRWASMDILVDAVLGVGFRGQLRPLARAIVQGVNGLSKPIKTDDKKPVVVAIDVPSGFNCDSGQLEQGATAVKADVTITFVAEKAGFSAKQARRYTGDVMIAPIGIGHDIIDTAMNLNLE